MPPQTKEVPPMVDPPATLSMKEVYGPYPKAIPTPFIAKDGSTPPSDQLEAAKSYKDLGDFPDYRDVGTPDAWLPRDGRLVRLTGRHPFNVEPPMSELRKTRFLTCLLYTSPSPRD